MEESNLTIEQAEAIIGGLFQQMSMMGAQDVEPALVEEIKRKLRAGETSPENAVSEVREILASKMDYH